ncbi:MAG TPA: hypothetical protein VKU01_32990 [Bryobacteraceae bacterium]|nr:hypothetical protein [Bryobacteraceae bacterium]
MAVSRRYVIRLSQALLAGIVGSQEMFGAEGESTSGWGSGRSSLFSRGTFTPLVNGGFAVRLQSGGTTWLTLLAVEDRTWKPPAYQPAMVIPSYLKLTAPRQLDTFALRFSGSGEPLPQGTYVLDNPSTGRFELFLVPSQSSTYTAIINRLPAALPSR